MADQTDSRGPTRGSHRLRFIVLLANMLLAILCGTSGILLDYFIADQGLGVMFAIQIVPNILAMGVAMFVIVMAGLGPGSGLIRFLGLSVFILFLSAVNTIAEDWQGDIVYRHSTSHALNYACTVMTWGAPLLTAAAILFAVGSFRRTRIAPPKVGPQRITIFSIMLATAMIGGLMRGLFVAQRALNVQLTVDAKDYEPNESTDADLLQESLMLTLAGGFVLSFACYVTSLAAYHRLPQILVAVTIIGLGSLLYFSNTQGGMPASILAGLAVGSGTAIAGACLWVIVCIRLMARSGWVYTKRTEEEIAPVV